MENTNKNISSILLAIILTVALILEITNISKATNNDTSLKSLSIEPSNYELVQDEENKDIYRVKVNNNVTSIKVNAVPNNSNAKVSVEGNTSLNIGTNKVTVKITAENGQSSEYIIYVRRVSTPISEETIIPNVQETVQNNDNKQNEQNSDKNQETKNEEIENENQENLILDNELNDIENTENIEQNYENVNENNLITDNKSNKNFIFGIILLTVLIILILIVIIIKNNSKHSKSKH